MRLTVELDREDDGRWIAEVQQLPGVMTYGVTRDDAVRSVTELARRVVEDKVAHRELQLTEDVTFTIT